VKSVNQMPLEKLVVLVAPMIRFVVYLVKSVNQMPLEKLVVLVAPMIRLVV